MVKGRLKLVDSQAAPGRCSNLLVGLSFPDQPGVPRAPRPPRVEASAAAGGEGSSVFLLRLRGGELRLSSADPDHPAQLNAQGQRVNRGTYVPPRNPGAAAFNFPPQLITWQNDAKHDEFWTHGAEDGNFTIANVRPGTYQLHAVSDGVLGAYDATATVTIAPGQKLDLGTIEWHPVRYGQQIWQIGTPNRSAKEFLKGDDHWHWGMYIEYAKLFPNDVDFTVGKSDPAKDWFIYQVPHDTEFKADKARSRTEALRRGRFILRCLLDNSLLGRRRCVSDWMVLRHGRWG